MLMFIHTSIYAIKNRVSYYYYIVYHIAYLFTIHIFVQLIAFKYIFCINMEIMIYVYISYQCYNVII